MNELVKITNQIQQCEKKDIAKEVMSVCRAITPQFYKNMSVEEVKAERMSIELLSANIDNDTLAEMCRRAILDYPKKRSENEKVYFDFNYILTFYKQAYNYVHCDSIKLSESAEKVQDWYEEEKSTIHQLWEDNGEKYYVSYITKKPKDKGHIYSPKDTQYVFQSIDDIVV